MPLRPTLVYNLIKCLRPQGVGSLQATLIESLVYEIGLGQVRPNWPGLTTIPAQPELRRALGLGQAPL